MSRLTFCLACVISVVIFTGCATRYRISQQNQDVEYQVQIISDPPGSKIEVNNDYVGEAPVTITMKGNRNRFARLTYRVVAYPLSHIGGSVQFKIVAHYEGLQSDPIPERMYFNTMLQRVPNVNVQLRE